MRGHLVYRSRLLSLRWPWRTVGLVAVLSVLTVMMGVAAMGMGDYPLSFSEVWRTLLGPSDSFAYTIVYDWRLPVVVAAAVFGALLGLGGAIFQSLTRNPLGSPDIIGFDAGSYTAVLLVMLGFHLQGYAALALASLLGGLAVAAAVYGLAYRRGVEGFRLIVVGIAISAMLGSLNTYLITRAGELDALAAGFWAAGSIRRVDWESLRSALPFAVLLMAAVAWAAPTLRGLELGDDAAAALGVRVQRSRLLLLGLGTATSALVTAAAGPIGFVALVAPQLAQRLARTGGVGLCAAAAMGAALLTGAHLLSLLLARAGKAIPVGLITVCVGGLYFIWLLVREARRGGTT